jgi:hypothetical protein
MILPGAHGEFLGELLGEQPGSGSPELATHVIESFLDGRP